MKENALTINSQSACELLIQEMGAQPLAQSVPELMQQINALRIERQWPMASSMSQFNPRLMPASTESIVLDLKPLRAFWEAGLIKVIKHDRHEGLGLMLACCKPLAETSGEAILLQLSRMFLELLPVLGLNEVEVLIELATRFDHFLRDASHLDSLGPEALLRDGLFYLSLKKPQAVPQAWSWTQKAHNQLQDRLHGHAKHLSQILYPEEDTSKIDKSLIEKNLIPLTDGLLFLGELHLRTRIISRLNKIEPRMLKIAVPVQLLMGEALRLI